MNPKSPVLTHKTKVDQRPVIRLVMEISFTEDFRDVGERLDDRVIDDGDAVVHGLKARRQDTAIGDPSQDDDSRDT